jgi:hypothetical protein
LPNSTLMATSPWLRMKTFLSSNVGLGLVSDPRARLCHPRSDRLKSKSR